MAYDQGAEAIERADRLRRRWDFAAAETEIDTAEAAGHSPAEVAIARGRVELYRDDPVAALARFEEAVELDPESERAVAWRIGALNRLNRFDDAIGVAEEGRGRFPDGADIGVALGRVYLNQEQPVEALAELDQVLGAHPDHEKALEWHVEALRTLCRYEEAETAALAALELYPRASGIQGSLALIHQDRYRYDEALSQVDAALADDPDDVSALQDRVSVMTAMCRYDQAEEIAAGAVERHPLVAPLYVEWSRVRDAQGRHDKALEVLDRVLEFQPNMFSALKERVHVLISAHRYEEAEAAVREGIERHPYSPAFVDSKAWLHHVRGEYDRAFDVVEKALVTHGRASMLLSTRILALQYLGRIDEAESAVEEVTEHRPHVSWALVFRGVQSQNRGRHEEALEWLERALEVDRHYVSAWTYKLSSLRSLERYAEAEEAAREAVRFAPEAGTWVEYGSVFADQQRFSEALRHFGTALELDPILPEAHNGKIDALIRQNRYAEAETAARAALRLRPNDASLLKTLARTFFMRDLDAQALEEYRRAVNTDPSDRFARCSEIRVLRFLERYAEAEKVVRDALRTWSRDSLLRGELGHVFFSQGRYEEALCEYERAYTENPTDYAALQWKIIVLRRSRRFTEAEEAARTEIDAVPGDSRFILELRRVYSDQGRYEEAEETLREARERFPRDASVRRSQIQLHQWLGRYDEALEECRRLLALRPQDTGALQSRARLLDDLGRHVEAEEVARAALRTHPNSVDLACRLGWILHRRGRYEEALAVFERAHEDTGDRWAGYGRASSLRHMGRCDQAALVLRQEFALRPNYATPLLRLCTIHWQQGCYEEALATAEEAVRAERFNVGAHETRVEALRRLRRFADAEAAARQALERLPNDEDLVISLGRVYEDLNRHEEALDCFERALELLPDYNEAVLAKSSALRAMRRFSEAERIVRSKVERFPRHRALRSELGWIHLDQGRLSEARDVFARLCEEAVNGIQRSDALIGLGWVAFTGEDHTEAERRFREAREADPLNQVSLVGLAWALVRRPDEDAWDEAERVCLELMETDPDNPRVRTCLGVLYYRRGQYPAAEHHLKHTVEATPHSGSYVDLGSLYLQLGRHDEARAAFDQALDRDRYDVQAHIGSGSLHLREALDTKEDSPEAGLAVQHFRQALAADPESASAAIGLALALTRSSGDFLAAERILREALKRHRRPGDPSEWQLLVALARVLIERGDATQRQEQYLEALAVAQEAVDRAGTESDPYFVAGVAAFKAAEQSPYVQARPMYRRRAVRYLRECTRRDDVHPEARRLSLLAGESLRVARTGLVGNVVLSGLASVMLVVLWLMFFLSDQVTAVMMTTLTPILIGLVALGFLLPLLTRLKLPGGVEADLSASLHQVSAGPTGDISVGPGRIGGSPGESAYGDTLGEGPRGHLRRLERE